LCEENRIDFVINWMSKERKKDEKIEKKDGFIFNVWSLDREWNDIIG
jgi:hypothetical protein